MEHGYDHNKRMEEFLFPNKFRLEDELRVGVTTATAGLVIGIGGVMRTQEGGAAPFLVTVSPTSDRVETVIRQRIGGGWLLHAIAFVVSGTLPVEGVHVTAIMERPSGATPLPIAWILGGTLTGGFQPSFPLSSAEPPISGAGQLRSITGTNPAADTEISETVPTGAIWVLRSWRATLVTGAAAATRQVHLVIDDGTNILLDIGAVSTQIISLTRNYNAYHIGAQSGSVDSEIPINVPPDIRLGAGFRIRTTTTNRNALDDWGAPQMLVEEWLVP